MQPILKLALMTVLLESVFDTAYAQSVRKLDRTTRLEASIEPGQTHKFELRLKQRESAELVVLQQGVDLVVDVLSPAGRVTDTVDSPNGRSGPEPVVITAAAAGAYTIQVRPIAPNEPAGTYGLTVTALRDAAATRQWILARRAARQLAIDWLRARSVSLPATKAIRTSAAIKPFDALAKRATVIGLGEATHGSREFADLRLAITRRLVEQHGYRLVTLEQSESRIRALSPYLNGEDVSRSEMNALLDSGWFGRRSRRDLVEWIRQWNIAHPAGRVSLIGVDAQDFAGSRAILAVFLPQAYGKKIAARWKAAEAELIAADDQSQVFGNSDISAPTRSFAVELLGTLEHDAPLLALRFDEARVRDAIEAARNLAQFSDYNGNEAGAINHNRDWYMAINVLRALRQNPGSKAVFWAHNAHVAATSASYQPTGTVLRSALGCGYGALGATFGEGSFIAQVPNDANARLALTKLPVADPESLEAAIGQVGTGGMFIAWPCAVGGLGVPPWLAQPRAMRWVGGLFTPGDAPSTATRPFTLTKDFDGVFYVPGVTAESAPANWPHVLPRPRK